MSDVLPTDIDKAFPREAPIPAGGRRCIALVSGGLDSLLAAHLLLDQGVRVTALRFATPFGCGDAPTSESIDPSLARRPGFELRVERLDEAFLDMVRKPAHGYGKRMNPCIDCKILMLRHARERMAPWGAQFVATGEVLDQRPMSQKLFALARIARESGLGGLLLRPLSAQRLPPTIPEQRGWVDRSRLGAIHGRGRKEQIEMARRYGVARIPQPAGGCLLTDIGFSVRLRDLLDHAPGATRPDFLLLRVGRRFRLSPACVAVVGRDERENEAIAAWAEPGDILFEPHDHLGPRTVLRGKAEAGDVATAAAMTLAHAKKPTPDPGTIRYWTVPAAGEPEYRFLTVPLRPRDAFFALRVGDIAPPAAAPSRAAESREDADNR